MAPGDREVRERGSDRAGRRGDEPVPLCWEFTAQCERSSRIRCLHQLWQTIHVCSRMGECWSEQPERWRNIPILRRLSHRTSWHSRRHLGRENAVLSPDPSAGTSTGFLSLQYTTTPDIDRQLIAWIQANYGIGYSDDALARNPTYNLGWQDCLTFAGAVQNQLRSLLSAANMSTIPGLRWVSSLSPPPSSQ